MNEEIANPRLQKKKKHSLLVLSLLALGSGIVEYAIQLFGWDWLWLDLATRLPIVLGVGFSIASWCWFERRQKGIEVSAFTFVAMGGQVHRAQQERQPARRAQHRRGGAHEAASAISPS